jgi:predicted outer membrane protein
MRTFFAVSLLLSAVTWLNAQEAGRTGNSANTAQGGQNASNSGTGQNAGDSAQTRDQKSKSTGQNPGATDQNRTDQNRNSGQNPATRQNADNSAQRGNSAGQGANESVERSGRATEGYGAGNSANLNSYFIACLRGDNRNEVEVGKLAAQKASNPEVKAFAQQMVKDHSDFLAKLDRINQSGSGGRPGASTDSQSRDSRSSAAPASATPATGRSDNTSPNETVSGANRAQSKAGSNAASDTAGGTDRAASGQATTKSAQANPGASDNAAGVNAAQNRRNDRDGSADQPGAGKDANRTVRTEAASRGGDYSQLIQIKQEIADQCLASTQRDLNEKQGKEFDKCYVGLQVVAHMEMVDTLTVFSRHASGELQQLVNEGRQTAQQHLDHVKHLAQQVDASGDGSGDRRSGNTGGKGTEKANSQKNN